MERNEILWFGDDEDDVEDDDDSKTTSSTTTTSSRTTRTTTKRTTKTRTTRTTTTRTTTRTRTTKTTTKKKRTTRKRTTTRTTRTTTTRTTTTRTTTTKRTKRKSERPASPSRCCPRPSWIRAQAPQGPGYERLKGLMRGLELHTVCEEAHCPNLGECWSRGTATFMILGDVCTRACGFCAVKTGLPGAPPDPDEPRRVADAVARMGLRHAVVTSVNRDDQQDGGAAIFAATIARDPRPRPGLRGRGADPRLQGALGRAAGRARRAPGHPEPQRRDGAAPLPHGAAGGELPALARAAAAVEGRGAPDEERHHGRASARSGPRSRRRSGRSARAGTDILTVGQYLRPSPQHLPVRALLHAGRSSRRCARSPSASASRTSSRARSSARATTRSQPPGGRGRSAPLAESRPRLFPLSVVRCPFVVPALAPSGGRRPRDDVGRVVDLGSVVPRPSERRSEDWTRSGGKPIARSTCEGSMPPAAQAAPVETATPSRSRAIRRRLGLDALERDVGRVRRRAARRRCAGRPGIASRRASSRSRSARDARPRPPRGLARERRGRAEADDARHVLGAGAAVALLRRRRARAAPSACRAARTGSPRPSGRRACAPRASAGRRRARARRASTLPAACTASQWTSAPRAWASRAASATGCSDARLVVGQHHRDERRRRRRPSRARSSRSSAPVLADAHDRDRPALVARAPSRC